MRQGFKAQHLALRSLSSAATAAAITSIAMRLSINASPDICHCHAEP
jgi:hypothetical protein